MSSASKRHNDATFPFSPERIIIIFDLCQGANTTNNLFVPGWSVRAFGDERWRPGGSEISICETEKGMEIADGKPNWFTFGAGVPCAWCRQRLNLLHYLRLSYGFVTKLHLRLHIYLFDGSSRDIVLHTRTQRRYAAWHEPMNERNGEMVVEHWRKFAKNERRACVERSGPVWIKVQLTMAEVVSDTFKCCILDVEIRKISPNTLTHTHMARMYGESLTHELPGISIDS